MSFVILLSYDHIITLKFKSYHPTSLSLIMRNDVFYMREFIQRLSTVVIQFVGNTFSLSNIYGPTTKYLIMIILYYRSQTT
jgi:hypothetical protein